MLVRHKCMEKNKMRSQCTLEKAASLGSALSSCQGSIAELGRREPQ